MKFAKLLYSVISLLTIFIIGNCKSKSGYVPPMEEELLEYFDNQPVVEASLEEIVFPNGHNVQQVLKKHFPDFFVLSNYGYINFEQEKINYASLINKAYAQNINPCKPLLFKEPPKYPGTDYEAAVSTMLGWAHYLATDSNHTFIKECQYDKNKSGIAYCWGGKNYKRLDKAKKHKNGDCEEWVFGLDCSGFIYHVLLGGGIKIANGTANFQRRTTNLNNALKRANLRIETSDIGKIHPDKMQSGDIIYWYSTNKNKVKEAYHIGMVFRMPDNKTYCFHSLGAGRECSFSEKVQKTICGKCAKNITHRRGVIQSDMSNMNKANSINGSSWGIVRFSPIESKESDIFVFDNVEDIVVTDDIVITDEIEKKDRTNQWKGTYEGGSKANKNHTKLRVKPQGNYLNLTFTISNNYYLSGKAKIISGKIAETISLVKKSYIPGIKEEPLKKRHTIYLKVNGIEFRNKSTGSKTWYQKISNNY